MKPSPTYILPLPKGGGGFGRSPICIFPLPKGGGGFGKRSSPTLVLLLPKGGGGLEENILYPSPSPKEREGRRIGKAPSLSKGGRIWRKISFPSGGGEDLEEIFSPSSRERIYDLLFFIFSLFCSLLLTLFFRSFLS